MQTIWVPDTSKHLARHGWASLSLSKWAFLEQCDPTVADQYPAFDGVKLVARNPHLTLPCHAVPSFRQAQSSNSEAAKMRIKRRYGHESKAVTFKFASANVLTAKDEDSEAQAGLRVLGRSFYLQAQCHSAGLLAVGVQEARTGAGFRKSRFYNIVSGGCTDAASHGNELWIANMVGDIPVA